MRSNENGKKNDYNDIMQSFLPKQKWTSLKQAQIGSQSYPMFFILTRLKVCIKNEIRRSLKDDNNLRPFLLKTNLV